LTTPRRYRREGCSRPRTSVSHPPFHLYHLSSVRATFPVTMESRSRLWRGLVCEGRSGVRDITFQAGATHCFALASGLVGCRTAVSASPPSPRSPAPCSASRSLPVASRPEAGPNPSLSRQVTGCSKPDVSESELGSTTSYARRVAELDARPIATSRRQRQMCPLAGVCSETWVRKRREWLVPAYRTCRSVVRTFTPVAASHTF
jgi:hypothetical protein